MARPSKAKIAELTSLYDWLKPDEYIRILDKTSDLDLIRALYDRANIFRSGDSSTFITEYFEKIMNGELISPTPIHDQFFRKNTSTDFGYLMKSKKIHDPKFIEPLSANHVLRLYGSIPYADDFLENQLVKRSWYTYTYEGMFDNTACFNINMDATDAEILNELQLLLPKLRKIYKKPPAIKQTLTYIEKLRSKNILALCDFLIFWKLKNLGEILKPIICQVIYHNSRTPDDIKDNELLLVKSILEGNLSELILMGRSLQE